MRRTIILAGIVLCLFVRMLAQETRPSTDPLAAVAGTNAVRLVTLEECVQLALQHNYAIRIEAFTPQLVGYDLAGAYAAYDPQFSVSAQHRFSSSEGGFDAQNRQFGNNTRETDVLATDLGGVLPTGLTYDLSADLNNSKGRSESVMGVSEFDTWDGAAGAFTLSQPFLRDFWIDNTRRTISILKKDAQISDLQMRFTVMDTVTQVEQAYYELMFALTNIVVNEDALRLAERSVYEVEKKVQVGTLPPLDQKQANAEVERAKTDLIAARYTALLQQNALKALITDKYTELQPIRLLPTESLEARPYVFDRGATWLEALSKRPDYKQQLLALDKAQIQLKYSRNQLFPSLDAFGTYGHAGFGETTGDVLDDWRRGNTPQYSYGLRLRLPLTFRAERNAFKSAKASEARERLRADQLEQGILIEIDDAVNRVDSLLQAVSSTRQGRIFAEAALDAEQKKFESGKSTTFNVLQFQRDLTASRRDEIRALVNYNQAISDLEFKKGSTLERWQVRIAQ